jgi:guanylate kinase
VTPTDPHVDPAPRRTGIPFVVSGPSGVGKTTLLRRVLSLDRGLAFGVSHTTRAPRAGERDGEDYRFVDEATFDRGVAEGRFLEWAVYQGHRYGTSLEAVEGPTGEGLDVILEVEVQGARQLRERLPGAVFVFVLSPSMDCLDRRLRQRRSESEEAIRERLARAREEVREVHRYDYVVVNDDLEQAVAALVHVIGALRVARHRVVPLLRNRFDFG